MPITVSRVASTGVSTSTTSQCPPGATLYQGNCYPDSYVQTALSQPCPPGNVRYPDGRCIPNPCGYGEVYRPASGTCVQAATSFVQPTTQTPTAVLLPEMQAPAVVTFPTPQQTQPVFTPPPISQQSQAPVCRAIRGEGTGPAFTDTYMTADGGSVSIPVPYQGQEPPVQCFRDDDSFLSPYDAYAQGSIQGLQRQLVLFAMQQGMAYSLYVDGRLTEGTLSLVMDVLLRSGFPTGFSMPRSDEDICMMSRALTRHLATKTGVAADFTPTTPVDILLHDVAKTPPVPTKKGFLTFKQALFGGLVIGGIVLLGRS